MSTSPPSDLIYSSFKPDRAVYRFARLFNRRLLVVEDDPDTWTILKRVGTILDPDLVIDFAQNTSTAVDRLVSEARYDAVLVDYCLPEAEVGAALRKPIETLQPWAQIALMSSSETVESKGWSFLQKPFSVSKCRSFLSNLLA